MVRHRPARFDSRDPYVLLPPSRELAFNGALVESDGILENSVARRAGVSFEAAARIVSEETESLSHQLKDFGSLMLGHLGELVYTEYGTVVFSPAPVMGWDCNYYGLRPLRLSNTDCVSYGDPDKTVATSVVAHGLRGAHPAVSVPVARWSDNSDEAQTQRGPEHGGIARVLVGVAASLAVIITLALFFINPIKVDNEPLKASIAPIENASVSDSETPAEVPSAIQPQGEDGVKTSTIVAGQSSQAIETDEAEVNTSAFAPEDKTVMTDGQLKAVPSGSPAPTSPRFDETDPFCVIIASFPEESLASRYLSENRSRKLGVLQQDGKYRVYAATGATYEEAAAQKQWAATPGAWICRR